MLKRSLTMIILYILMHSAASADVTRIHRIDNNSLIAGWEVLISRDELTDEITNVVFRNGQPDFRFMLLFGMCAVGEGNSEKIKSFLISMNSLRGKMNGVGQMDAEVFIRMDAKKISHYKGYIISNGETPDLYLTKYYEDGVESEESQENTTQKLFKELSSGLKARIRVIAYHPSGKKEYNVSLPMGATKKALDLANCDLIHE